MKQQKQQRYYVVWVGVTPGIYETWTACQLQIKGYAGARFKSFATRPEAEEAFASRPERYLSRPAASRPAASRPAAVVPSGVLPPEVVENSLAVDAACSGNPGQMEYRGVHVGGRQQLFHFGPVYGTNNIGEFLAIVHALALLDQRGLKMPVYSDSVNAILWVKKKKCRTKLERTGRTEPLFQLIERAERWLQTHPYDTPVLKWETRRWGEIPADFGRK
ncbi:MAG: ribonuclease H family protein [Prevotellaceae bacterium]|jgi:ribonuclease HI|nr:ribonuclease H family protein [Prevotellaceae bacterium]